MKKKIQDYHSNYNVMDIDVKEKMIKKYGEEKLFSLAFNYPLDFNEKHINPLRLDNNPGAFFSKNKKGELVFRDFAFGNKPLNVWDFLKIFYNTYDDNKLENLIENAISNKKIVIKKPLLKRNYKNTNNINLKLYAYPKIINGGEYEKFWLQYGIDSEILEKEYIYYTKKYIYQDKIFEAKYMTFVYVYKKKENIKLYMPYNKDLKFLSDYNEVLSGQFQKNKRLFITKSRKDYLVLKYILGLNTAYVEGEIMYPEIDKLEGIPEIILCYDNDKTGIENSIKIQNYLKNSLNIPIHYILPNSAKDWSDVIKISNYKNLKNEFKRAIRKIL